MRSAVVIAHPDDEVVGCFTLLSRGEVSAVLLYNPLEEFDKVRLEELEESANTFNFSLLKHPRELADYDVIIAPYPNDRHMAHKIASGLGVTYAVELGARLMFYSVNMEEGFVFPLPRKIAVRKRDALMKIYASQGDLWRSDARYYLFEGIVEVIRPCL